MSEALLEQALHYQRIANDVVTVMTNSGQLQPGNALDGTVIHFGLFPETTYDVTGQRDEYAVVPARLRHYGPPMTLEQGAQFAQLFITRCTWEPVAMPPEGVFDANRRGDGRSIYAKLPELLRVDQGTLGDVNGLLGHTLDLIGTINDVAEAAAKTHGVERNPVRFTLYPDDGGGMRIKQTSGSRALWLNEAQEIQRLLDDAGIVAVMGELHGAPRVSVYLAHNPILNRSVSRRPDGRRAIAARGVRAG